jgi:uncharacterized membrane protein YfcA
MSVETLASNPADLNTLHIALVLFAIGLGGFVKGFIGLGLPLIAIPIMSTVIDPRTSVAILALPMIVSNLVQARTGGHVLTTAYAFRWLLIPLACGSAIGTMIITGIPVDYAKAIVGGIVVAFALLTLSGKQPVIPSGMDRIARPAIGLFGGIIGGMTSFFGPPVIPYLMSLRLEKTRFVQVMGMAFMIGSIPLLIGMIVKGFAPPNVLLVSVAGVAAVFVSMYIGGLLRNRVPQALFMKLIAVMLIIIGGRMLWFSLMS